MGTSFNETVVATRSSWKEEIGETLRNDLVKATGNRVFHPEGQSKPPEASLARVLATRFVKRRQCDLFGSSVTKTIKYTVTSTLPNAKIVY
jgi:hypothetical protein